MEELTIWVDQKRGELPVRDAILAITDDWVDYGNCCNATVVDLRNACAALQAEVERLREERRWIPVEEKLPGNYATVLVSERRSVGVHAPPFAAYCVDGLWLQVGYKARLQVTHWMPLPATPDAG